MVAVTVDGDDRVDKRNGVIKFRFFDRTRTRTRTHTHTHTHRPTPHTHMYARTAPLGTRFPPPRAAMRLLGRRSALGTRGLRAPSTTVFAARGPPAAAPPSSPDRRRCGAPVAPMLVPIGVARACACERDVRRRRRRHAVGWSQTPITIYGAVGVRPSNRRGRSSRPRRRRS